MSKQLDKMILLSDLNKIEYKDKDKKEETIKHMSLAESLLIIAEITHEKEYSLCREVASHLLKKIPETDDLIEDYN